MLSALCTFASSFAGTALGSEKTLKLSVEWSDLFAQELPKLSVSAPLTGNEASLRLEIGDDLLNFIANYNEVEKHDDFFREVRNLRDVQARFEIRHVDGTMTQKAVNIAPNAPLGDVVQLPEFIISAHVRVEGIADVYKCFDVNTCVSDGTRRVQLRVVGRPVSARYNYQTVTRCGDTHVEQATNYPEIRRLVINRTIARMIKLDDIIIAKVQPGPQLFTANLENFGLEGGPSFPGAKLEVIRENKALKLRMTHPRGHWYDVYTFRCNILIN